MNDMNSDEFGTILEDINGKLDQLTEVMSTLATNNKLDQVEEKVVTKLDTLTAVVKDQNHQLQDHENRLTVLEAA